MHMHFYNIKSCAHQTERVDTPLFGNMGYSTPYWFIKPIYLVSLIFGFSRSKLVYGF